MTRLALALTLLLGLMAPASAQEWLPGGVGTPIVCAYNSSPPTVATGLFIYAQCDTNGKLISSGGGGGGGAVTLASGAVASGAYSSGSIAAGAISAGAAVSGAFVAGSIADLAHGQGTMAASVPVAIASNQSNLPDNLAAVEGTSLTSLLLATSTAPVTATNQALTVDLRPDSPGIITLGPAAASGAVPHVLSSQYPVNNNTTTPTAETISATGTSAAFTATLAVGTASQTVYICGAEIDAAATAGLAVAATITGTVTGTLNFVEEVSTLTGTGVGRNVYNFNPCIPASAANTTIVVHAGAAGSGGISSISAWGYLL